MGLFETIGTSVGGIVSAKKNREEAARNKRRNTQMVEGMDWTPTYANNLMSGGGQYKKTESPLAESYLQSILTGSNPDMVFSGSPNAGAVKQEKIAARADQFGSPDELLARQRKVQSANPYQTWTPDDPRYAESVAASKAGPAGTMPTAVAGAAPGVNDLGAVAGARTPGGGTAQDYQTHYPLLVKMGISEQQHKEMVDAGVLGDWENRDAVGLGTSADKQDGAQKYVGQQYHKAYELMKAGKVQEAQRLIIENTRILGGASQQSGRVV